jgi:uncharacterized protein with von Willebrand factor type A (vWA) domain
MSKFEPKAIAQNLFNNLRIKGFDLGVGELLAALQAIDGGFGNDLTELESTLRLLWSHTAVEYGQFQLSWADVIARQAIEPKPKAFPKEVTKEPDDRQPSKPFTQTKPKEPDNQPPSSQLEPLPVRAPRNEFTPIESENIAFQTSFPLTRRYMAYAWRSLRQPVADGKQDVLDVATTVSKVARQGFFLSPVYKRRIVNRAHLVLLIDRKGSMMPFHRFAKDLVDSAQTESKIQTVDVYYFHNIPATCIYRDPFLTEPIALNEAIAAWDSDTKILIVSDAGAARGLRLMERIQSTIEFLLTIKQATNLIAWLNPMPQERWVGSSAKIIANVLPMLPMDRDGLCRAIEVLQGKVL